MSSRRKKRREAERQRLTGVVDAPAPLRLVRSEGASLPSEPLPAGRASEALDSVRGPERDGGIDPPQTVESDVPSPAPVEDAIPVNLVRRSFDPAEINPTINDPDIFPCLSIPGIDHLDIAPVLADQRNVLLLSDNGGILFCWLEPCIYEVHTALRKPERGSHGNNGAHNQNVCRAAYRWMFTQTDCMVLHTRIPATNRAAATFAPLLGWIKEFERKAVWPTSDGRVDMSFFALRYDDWLRKTPEVSGSGREFHILLEQEFARHQRAGEQHADEDCHDRSVGAAFEMMRGGQIEKAVFLYNRWARFAGYVPIGLVSRQPAVLDIGNA